MPTIILDLQVVTMLMFSANNKSVGHEKTIPAVVEIGGTNEP